MKWWFFVVFIVEIGLLSGCASNRHWEHPSKGQQEWYVDDSRCRAMSGNVGMGSQIIPIGGEYGTPAAQGFAQGWNQGQAMRAVQDRERVYTHCMMGDGWRLVDDSVSSESNGLMLCQTSYDCPPGYSCRSKRGGGTECRVSRSVQDVQ